MTTYVMRNGKLVEKGTEPYDSEVKRVHIISDIEPYQSMVDGTRITSRSHHREHLRTHGVIEVGNEKMESKPKQIDREARRAVLRQQVRAAGITDSRASEIMNSLARQYRR